MAVVRLPDPPKEYDQKTMARIVRDIERLLEGLSRVAALNYTTTNIAASRALDASATLPETVAVLGTLIQDLKSAGRIG